MDQKEELNFPPSSLRIQSYVTLTLDFQTSHSHCTRIFNREELRHFFKSFGGPLCPACYDSHCLHFAFEQSSEEETTDELLTFRQQQKGDCCWGSFNARLGANDLKCGGEMPRDSTIISKHTTKNMQITNNGTS